MAPGGPSVRPREGVRASVLQALAGLSDQRDCLRKDDPDRVADLNGLLVARTGQLHGADRSGRHVDGELDRVVGPGDLLSSLHLLLKLLHSPAHLLGIAEESTETFHAFDHRPVTHSALVHALGGTATDSVTPVDPRPDCRLGAASVEYVALAGMIGTLIVAAIAALIASPPTSGERELGEMLV